MDSDPIENKEIFREYDIRGIYPDQINEGLVSVITEALAQKVFKKGDVVIGHDARLSSPQLYKVALRALGKYKDLKVIEAGMITTPMLNFLIVHLEACGGMMITASHNPGEYNGIKAINQGAAPISGKDILKFLS
jgi:phosphomannomutase